MDEICHGCAQGNKDGLHVLITKDGKCLIPTTDCFWKDPYDVINYVKTCTQTENQKNIGWKSMMNYFNRKRENQNSI